MTKRFGRLALSAFFFEIAVAKFVHANLLGRHFNEKRRNEFHLIVTPITELLSAPVTELANSLISFCQL